MVMEIGFCSCKANITPFHSWAIAYFHICNSRSRNHPQEMDVHMKGTQNMAMRLKEIGQPDFVLSSDRNATLKYNLVMKASWVFWGQ